MLGMPATDEFDSLDGSERVTVLQAIAVVYRMSINSIMAIKAEGNCYDREFEAVPGHKLINSIKISTADFCCLLAEH